MSSSFFCPLINSPYQGPFARITATKSHSILSPTWQFSLRDRQGDSLQGLRNSNLSRRCNTCRRRACNNVRHRNKLPQPVHSCHLDFRLYPPGNTYLRYQGRASSSIRRRKRRHQFAADNIASRTDNRGRPGTIPCQPGIAALSQSRLSRWQKLCKSR